MELVKTRARMKERCVAASPLARKYGLNPRTFHRILTGQFPPPQFATTGVYWRAIEALRAEDLLRDEVVMPGTGDQGPGAGENISAAA